MQTCENKECNNDVDWIDEPEDLCAKCTEEAVKEYEAFLLKEAELSLVT